MELGFNWTALIGLLHLEVESAVDSLCEVFQLDLNCMYPDRYSVLLTTALSFGCVCGGLLCVCVFFNKYSVPQR